MVVLKPEWGRSRCDVVANVIDYKIIVNDFELQLSYYIHFQTNTPG